MTIKINIPEAKANLSQLVNLVYHGERVLITKHDLPVAELVGHKPEKIRELGLLEGKFAIPEDLTAHDEEIEAMFYGPDAGEPS